MPRSNSNTNKPLSGPASDPFEHELDEAEAASLDEAIAPIDDAHTTEDDHHPAGSDQQTGLGQPPASYKGVIDRRLGLDRRDMAGSKPPTGLERRRGRGRRLSDFHRSAEEGEMTQEQFMFLMAIDAFKKGNNVTFPAWSDVLEVIRLLGYRKVQPSAVNLGRAEDWTEPPESPHKVRTDKQLERHAAARAAFRKGDEAA